MLHRFMGGVFCKLKKLKTRPYLLAHWILEKSGISSISDFVYLKILWRRKKGYALNLKNPLTFNEKIQWLKLYDRKAIYSKMVDKAEVKDYAASIIGKEYIIPTLGIWNHPDQIDTETLPEKFVLKCTHDSASVCICRDKSTFDFEFAFTKLNNSLKKDWYKGGKEWAYKNVTPRIIAEQLLEDPNSQDQSDKSLNDYKLYCFNGSVKIIKVDFNRESDHKANFYDLKFKPLYFGLEKYGPDYKREIKTPLNLDLMIELAEKLSQNLPFIRVDFYNLDGNLYFGELTFYPDGGFVDFYPNEWNFKLGEYLKLPSR